MRRVIQALAIGLGLCAGSLEAEQALPFGTDLSWLGRRSGPMLRPPAAANKIVFQNDWISAGWTLAPDGLRGNYFRDEQSGRTIASTGEVFQIVLRGGRTLAASGLRRVGAPVFSDFEGRADAARLADRIGGRRAEVRLRSEEGDAQLVWRVIGRDDANYVRQELEITASGNDLEIEEVRWLEETVPEAAAAGLVDGVAVTAGGFFFGVEDPMASNAVRGGEVLCRLPRHAVLRRGEKWTVSFVMGVAPAGQMRRAFLFYVERERAHPYRSFLHYNSWYDIAWDPFALNEANCLEAIRVVGERLIRERGVVVDSMVFDDGWDDPRSLWKFHSGFPRGFGPLAETCRKYRTHLGVWLSPFGGYGDSKRQRLEFGSQNGFETNGAGFSLAGPKYYEAFKSACVGMIRKYGVNQFKFDGIAAGMYANGPAGYVLDTEAMRRLMVELREESAGVYINLTTGSWPSPFWLRYADSLWRQGGDMGLAGKGSKQQQWLTYRDQETYRNVVGKSRLYPLNSLMTQGVAYSRRGTAGEPTFNSAGFKEDVRAFFGSGTSLQELYIQPGKLSPADWSVLAEAAKWSRANTDVLVDTHWIGGDPSRSEVYGYASWSRRKGVVMLRNPDDQPHRFELEPAEVFELPAEFATGFMLRSPWAEDAANAPLKIEAGGGLELLLAPFQVLVFDALPAQSGANVTGR